jgi:hypothetical protein
MHQAVLVERNVGLDLVGEGFGIAQWELFDPTIESTADKQRFAATF